MTGPGRVGGGGQYMLASTSAPSSREALICARSAIHEQGTDGRVYHTAPVDAPTGERVAEYRKIFVWRPHETTASGGIFVVFDLPDHGRIGLTICCDAWFP